MFSVPGQTLEIGEALRPQGFPRQLPRDPPVLKANSVREENSRQW